jgi:hypothetical protein
MTQRTTLRVLFLVCAMFLVHEDAGAQSREVSLSSTPFRFAGPAFQDMSFTARDLGVTANSGRRISVFFSRRTADGLISMIEAGGDYHFTVRRSLKKMIRAAQKPALDRGDKLSWGNAGRMVIGLGRYDYRRYTVGPRTCVGFTNYFKRSGDRGWEIYILGNYCGTNTGGDEELRSLFSGIGIDRYYTPTLAATAPREIPADKNPAIAKEKPSTSSGKTRGDDRAALPDDAVDGVYTVRLIYAGQDKPGCLGNELTAEFTLVQETVRGYFNHPQVGFFLLKGRIGNDGRLINAVAEGAEKVFFDGSFGGGAGTGTWRSDQLGCRGAWAATRN